MKINKIKYKKYLSLYRKRRIRMCQVASSFSAEKIKKKNEKM